VNIHGKVMTSAFSASSSKFLCRITLSEFGGNSRCRRESETLKEQSRTHLYRRFRLWAAPLWSTNLSRFEEDYTYFVEALDPALSADDFLRHCDVVPAHVRGAEGSQRPHEGGLL